MAVPLSENEQRQLEAIERGLYADDPKFAASVRASDLRSHNRRRLYRAVALFVIGLVVMIIAVTPAIANNSVKVTAGVVGFLLMFLAAVLAASAFRRLRSPSDNRFGGSSGRPTSRRAESRPGWRERAEERFRRRFEDNG